MKILIGILALSALLSTATRANAAVNVGVDPSAPWIGYMNVFELPENGGGYVFGSGWGTADLNAGFTGDVLTLSPNTSIARDNPASDRFWWKPDGSGNKTMDANFYVEDSATLPGQVVTFTGEVLGNTLVSPYTSVAFIKDFAPDYSSFTQVTAPLVNGVFNITLATDIAPGRHVQYGFETIGPNASFQAAPGLGSVQITAAPTAVIPEPSSLVLFATGSLGLLGLRRRRT